MTRNAEAVVLADIVERADVRVSEGRDRARFALESLAELRVGGKDARENLDGDGAVESRVAGPVDLAHAAGAERRHDFVRAEADSGHQGHPALFRRGGASAAEWVTVLIVSVRNSGPSALATPGRSRL